MSHITIWPDSCFRSPKPMCISRDAFTLCNSFIGHQLDTGFDQRLERVGVHGDKNDSPTHKRVGERRGGHEIEAAFDNRERESPQNQAGNDWAFTAKEPDSAGKTKGKRCEP